MVTPDTSSVLMVRVDSSVLITSSSVSVIVLTLTLGVGDDEDEVTSSILD